MVNTNSNTTSHAQTSPINLMSKLQLVWARKITHRIFNSVEAQSWLSISTSISFQDLGTYNICSFSIIYRNVSTLRVLLFYAIVHTCLRVNSWIKSLERFPKIWSPYQHLSDTPFFITIYSYSLFFFLTCPLFFFNLSIIPIWVEIDDICPFSQAIFIALSQQL